MDLITLAIRTIIWILTATVNTGPWIMENIFVNVIAPLVGRERTLAMGRGTIIPICMLFLGAFWGGIWLLFWGALGSADLAGWGVGFGAVAGWKAGVLIADDFERARVEIRLDEHDQSTTDSVPEKRIDNRAGEIDLGAFDKSLPPEDELQPSDRK